MALAGLYLLPTLSIGASVSVSVDDLTDALFTAGREPDAVTRMVLDEIEAQIEQSPVVLANGELVFTETITNRVVEDGCTNTTVQRVDTDITLAGTTGISIQFESLFDPLSIALDLSASVAAAGRAKQNFGVRLGSCVALASDTFDFTATGPLRLQLDLSINLNPVWIDASTLQIKPTVTVDGQLREGQITVDVNDSLLRSLIEDFLQSEVNALLGPGAIEREIESLQQRIDTQLRAALNDGNSDGALNIELPDSSDEQIAALYELLTPRARFPLTASFIETYRLSLLAALIVDDQDAITEILGNAAECELGGILQSAIATPAMYELAGASCVAVDDVTTDGIYYSDSSCAMPFDFVQTDLAAFCVNALDSKRLGNAQSNTSSLQKWTLSPGNTFELGVLGLRGKKQPFSQRLQYKAVQNDAGECALEMRVYASSPSASNQKTLIALHGGSWQRRGSGFLGVEHMATHFVNQGYVVFAPFYRLIGSADSTAACHNASLSEITEDTNDAFDWVLANQQRFGASGQPVVFGQSAGGHLALSLAVQRPAEIASAVLFYAPTDFADFASQYRNGEYNNPQGQRIIEAVTGSELDGIDVSSALIQQNSFPAIIAADPARYPPVYMLHGESDSLLPARQSERLCNSLSGNANQGPASVGASVAVVSRTISCDDRGSELHLIGEGEHTLDLCISPELCLAGSPASAAATGKAIERMLKWVESPADLVEAPAVSGGGTGGVWWFLWFFILIKLYVKKMIRNDSKC